jgi:2-oxoglutarate ferredoxin oxidoreductase subunit beta
MLYVIENNGVYGLTKGQFSASADVGSKLKKGEQNQMAPIDPVFLGLAIGATFVARSFSGDKQQLVPILKAALKHRGLALVDIISPCVTFNDHEGSTKSYLYTRRHEKPVARADLVPPTEEILAPIGPKGVTTIAMHDGSRVRFRLFGLRSPRQGHSPSIPAGAADPRGDSTGLLYLNESVPTCTK